MASTATQERVPVWEIAWSSSHKAWFYQDRKTGQSSWGKPFGCNLELPKDPPPDRPGEGNNGGKLPKGWEAEWDPKHKQYYYFNRLTRERSWRRPSEQSAAPPPPTAFPAAQPAGASQPVAANPSAGGAASKPAVVAGPSAGIELSRPNDRGLAQPKRPEAPGGPNSEPAQRTAAGGAQAASQRQPRTARGWDAAAWLRRLQQAGTDRYQLKAVRREVAESNYLLRDQWPVPQTTSMTADRVLRAPLPQARSDTVVSFSCATTVDAIEHFVFNAPGHKVCALNFANGKDIGGGYKSGAVAQEEDLCRRIPCLYTSLFNAKRAGLYPFGPGTCASADRPNKYSDVLWTPGATVGRAGEIDGFALLPAEQQASVSLVAAAAPNLRFADPPELFDSSLVYNTVKTLLITPRLLDPETTTIILGAWGCGAFGCDPREVSELFCRALEDGLGRLYKEVHFAIPGGPADANRTAFKEALGRHGIKFREISLGGRG